MNNFKADNSDEENVGLVKKMPEEEDKDEEENENGDQDLGNSLISIN